MNCVEKLTSILLGLIIIASTVSSVQYIYADHLESDKGIFRSHGEVNLVTSKGTSLNDIVTTGDSNFEIYLSSTVKLLCDVSLVAVSIYLDSSYLLSLSKTEQVVISE